MAIKKMVLASSNQGKLVEIQELLAELPVTLVAQTDLGVSDADETGLSFIENALIKARHAAEVTGLPAIGDDSGLCVDALNGAPGLYSARFAGKNTPFSEKIQHLLKLMQQQDNPSRSAYFVCVMAFVRHTEDPMPIIAEGICHGEIMQQPSGVHGFGYDPIFYLPQYQKTAAEIDPALKNEIGHRGLAVKSLLSKLRATLG